MIPSRTSSGHYSYASAPAPSQTAGDMGHVSSASTHASAQTTCCGQRSKSDYHLVWQIFLQDQISREYSWQTTTIVNHLRSSAGKRSSLAITSTGGTQGLQGRTCTASSPCPSSVKLTLTQAVPTKGFQPYLPSDSRISGVFKQTLF